MGISNGLQCREVPVFVITVLIQMYPNILLKNDKYRYRSSYGAIVHLVILYKKERNQKIHLKTGGFCQKL